MKVISMVPSWTEMLIECGVNVVGRTRFCLHPRTSVARIPPVGGTKDWDLEKVSSLSADLVILDQEENQAWMKTQAPCRTVVTHVTDVRNVSENILRIQQALGGTAEPLSEVALRWENVARQKLTWSWQEIPGELGALKKTRAEYQQLVYVIWKNPWMTVSRETFIGSVLELLGAGAWLVPWDRKYPSFDIETFDRTQTYFLFSTEPFPFHKKKEDLLALEVEGSFVDGEKYSWFGVRTLHFLESILESRSHQG